MLTITRDHQQWEQWEGRIIHGRYELRQYLAQGGMSAVFRGWDHHNHMPLAIKVASHTNGAEQSHLLRFRREARIGALLDNPHIVRCFDFAEEAGNAYLMLELIDGINLKEHIARRGSLTATEAFAIASQICDALDDLHARGFIHRDIKPQNILLGSASAAKLTDLGIVYAPQDENLTQHGTVMGTVAYLAPEQALGKPLTPGADLYALGVVLFESLTGMLPFTGNTPIAIALHHVSTPPPLLSELRPDLPPVVESIVKRALEKEPEDRFPSAQALRDAMDQASAALTTGAGVQAGDVAPAYER
jgi:eukaryotic-like serine/threonine-protein kinase